jgi:hypothetical protein
VVGIAVEHAALEDAPTPAPPDAADAEVVGACVLVLAPSPANWTAFWGLMNGDALIAPAVELPVVTSPDVGKVEVGTLRGSAAEAALEVVVLEDVSTDKDDAGEPGCVVVELFDPVMAAGNGAMVVGATPACCVGCPTCACELA